MSVSDPQHAPGGPAPAPMRCPRCGAPVGPEQDWCLECGAPARTRLAPTPSWRLPVAILLAVVLAAGVALAIAFAALTNDDGVVTATTTAAAPAQPNDTTVPGAGPAGAGTLLPGSTATPASTATPPSTATPSSTATPPATGTP